MKGGILKLILCRLQGAFILLEASYSLSVSDFRKEPSRN